MRYHVLVCLALFLSSVAARGGSEAGSGEVSLRELVERFAVDRADLSRFYRLPMSGVRHERLTKFCRRWQERLDAVDFRVLSQEGRVDFLLLENHLRFELQSLAYDEQRNHEVREIAPFAATLVRLEEERRAMQPVETEAMGRLLSELTKEVDLARERLEAAGKGEGEEDRLRKLAGNPSIVRRTELRLEEVGRSLTHWYEYHQGYDPLFTWWTERPFTELKKALESYLTTLAGSSRGDDGDEDDGMVGDPIGREALQDELIHEMIPYGPEELVAIADREFKWCDREMQAAASELGFEDWHDALEQVKTRHVQPGGQDDLVKELAEEAVAFLDEHELVTIPDLCRETWRMEMMSPERQLTSPFFLYGGQQIIVSYPTAEMTHEQKLMSMRGNNRYFSRATVHHELMPGHHLQGFMAARHRPWRRSFSTPFLIEGWALHWELLLWERGFPRTPEDRIGMLFWRMHRCARIIVSLGFHLGTMQPPEMVEFLIERVGHEPDNARAEVRRYVGGSYGPLYQCAYLIGGLQLRALHAELVGSGRMTDQTFHDAVLREGPIPIELLRAALTGQELDRHHQPCWRF